MLKTKNHTLLSLTCLLVATLSACAPVTQYPYSNAVATTAAVTAAATENAVTPIRMMASAVRLRVTVNYTKFAETDNQSIIQPDKESWSGSGVVYDKTSPKDGPVRSRILSANHVLETPVVGKIEDNSVTFLGIEISLGKRRVDAVKVELQTADGRVCNVKVLALGSSDQHDTATAEADCDAGPVAELATAIPVMGEKVFISGYSQGVLLPMLTEGYVSGLMDGYILTSAPAYSGNSGGPVFYKGKVIGLLVRGSREYPNLTLVVGLEECLRRIQETPPL